MKHYHFIIVGGGSAGCVLAARLSAKSDCRVLLLEAGDDVVPEKEQPDIADVYPTSYFNPRYAWSGISGHWLTKQNSPCSKIKQACILGGGSSIMGMVALRGISEDYDEWESSGATGWGWRDVEPFFKLLEADQDFPNSAHGTAGPVPIRRIGRGSWPPLLSAIAREAERKGVTVGVDLNGTQQDGWGAAPLSISARGRVSASMAYLTRDVRRRPNLTVLTRAHVEQLIFDANQAKGVRAVTGNTCHEFTASEVILSAGALRSPQMLLQAGIGPGDHLLERSVAVRAHRPGVGRNLQNHQILYLLAQLKPKAYPRQELRFHTIAMDRYSSNAAGCARSDMALAYINQTGWHALGQRLPSLASIVLKPYSRGRVELDVRNPSRADICFNMRADPRDGARHEDGIRRAVGYLNASGVRHLIGAAVPVVQSAKMRALNDINVANKVRAQALSFFIDTLPSLGNCVLAPLTKKSWDIDRLRHDGVALRAFTENAVMGMAHPVGTCRMGSESDPGAVVDSTGRVYGVQGLRVVDASVMPSIPRGNTNLPTMMIAEKIAQHIIDELKGKR